MQSKSLLAVALLGGAALLLILLASSVPAPPVEGAEPTSRFAAEPASPGPDAPALPASFEAALDPPAGPDSAPYQVECVCRTEGIDSAPTVALTRGLTLEGDGVRVLVQAEPGEEASARAAILAAGGRLLSSYGDLLAASVPPGRFSSLIADGAVLRIDPDLPATYDDDPLLESSSLSPVVAAIASGEIVSEGLAETNADTWHAAGYKGQGIKIGLIDFGFSGYLPLLGTELPSAVTLWGKSPAGPEGEGTNHGTDTAEVIHDMAPQADLFLARIDHLTDFGMAKDWLLSQGVQVINFSGGWHCAGILDGGGEANAIVTDAISRGVFWAGAAGNFRKGHWMGDFTDTDGDGLLNWDGQEEAQVIWADAGETISGYLTWEDSWTSASQDYDLYLYRWDGQKYVYETGCGNRQDGTTAADHPVEQVTYTAPSDAAYAWFIKRDSADRTDVDFDFLSVHNDFDDGYNNSYFDHGRSIQVPADNRSRGFMAAAAINRGPTFAQEDYSSEGPTRDGRIAPEIAAPSDIQTSSGRFWGTSCASPHLAGAAALVLQAYPSFTPVQVEEYLKTNAIDLGTPGPDNQYGYGRLHLPAPPSSQGSFPDVPASHPYGAAISGMADRGIISGYDDGTFGPGNPVKRQQFAKIIVRALELAVSTSDICPFADVGSGMDPKDPLYPNRYVAVCSARGITQGKTSTTFDPGGKISRAQLVTMVVRALNNLRPGTLTAPPPGYYGTLGDFSLDHAANMAKAEHNGLLVGLMGFGPSWDPWQNAIRGEVAQLLWNALLLGDGTPVLPTPLFQASLRNRDYGSGEAIPTMEPDRGASPNTLGIADSAQGVTFTSTEADGHSNALINWEVGGSKQFRQTGVIAFSVKMDRATFVPGELWGENYGYTKFNHGQGAISAAAALLENGASTADDQVKVYWHSWHNAMWFPMEGTAISFGSWHRLAFIWGGPHDFELWVDGSLAYSADLPAGMSLPWGMDDPPSATNVGLGSNHQRGYQAYCSVAGATFADIKIWNTYVCGASASLH